MLKSCCIGPLGQWWLHPENPHYIWVTFCSRRPTFPKTELKTNQTNKPTPPPKKNQNATKLIFPDSLAAVGVTWSLPIKTHLLETWFED